MVSNQVPSQLVAEIDWLIEAVAEGDDLRRPEELAASLRRARWLAAHGAPQRPSVRYWVATVTGGADPTLHGPFDTTKTARLAALRLRVVQDRDADATFFVVDDGSDLTVEPYGRGIGRGLPEPDEDPGPACRFCGQLAGPDYRLVGADPAGAPACPACFDERLV